MQGHPSHRTIGSAIAVAVAIAIGAIPALAAEVVQSPSTQGCTGVLPSNDGNTDMRVVGGSMTPGGTALFEITYPVNASSIGKEFTILDCAFINDVPALKYIVSFVPSNQSYVLAIELAVPVDAPVGGQYCNYVKTTGSPTASQASQRKAGPACFTILPPAGPTAPRPGPGTQNTPPTSGSPPGGVPPFLPNTAMPRDADWPQRVR